MVVDVMMENESLASQIMVKQIHENFEPVESETLIFKGLCK